MPRSPSPKKNHFLAALPADIQDRLFPHLELTPLPFGKILYETGDTVREVYFPTDAIVSLLYKMQSGESAGISMVGNEGLVGVGLIMGEDITSNRVIVQSAGNSYRLPSQHLTDEFNRHGDLLLLSLLYAQTVITQMAQTVVCNRHHSIEQQLCRWLLMSLDRLPGNRSTMAVTQKLIANMLGVRREGITDATGKLQKRGVIEHSRGHITVLSRPGLEQTCCECYTVVKKETDRLLPFVSAKERDLRSNSIQTAPSIKATSTASKR